MKIYRITTSPGAEIHTSTTLFERTGCGTRGWTVDEVWSGGSALSDSPIVSDAQLEFERLETRLSAEFEFDEWFSEEERNRIKHQWVTDHRSVLASDRWRIEDEAARVIGPIVVEMV